MITVAVALLAGQASADVLTEYDIQHNSSAKIGATNEADHVTGGALTANGVDALTDYGDGIFVANGWTESSQRDPKKYYEWSLTADDGYAITYDTIDLSLVRGNYQSKHGADMWQLYATTDDGVETLLATWDISSSKFDSIVLLEEQDISLLGTQAGTVMFRLYGYDADNKKKSGDYSGLAYGHSDLTGIGTNLVISGDVGQVPEPATMALLTIGGAGLLLRRRRRTA